MRNMLKYPYLRKGVLLMDAVKLSGLEPKAVFSYFEQLCAIPHGSGNTKKISDFIVSFAKDHQIP